MDTSGGSVVNAIAYVFVIVVPARAAIAIVPVPRALWRPQPAAVALWLTVAIPSVIGLVWSPLTEALRRDPERIRDGQIWRLLTSAVVQDGGVLGTGSNLVYLAVAAVLAVALWGPVRAVLLFVVGAVAFNIVFTYGWQAVGAGNSAATFFLAASTVGLLAVRAWGRTAAIGAAIEAVIGAILLVLDDGHAIAVLGGLVVGLVAALLPGAGDSIAALRTDDPTPSAG